jgi:hypothetical protein
MRIDTRNGDAPDGAVAIYHRSGQRTSFRAQAQTEARVFDVGARIDPVFAENSRTNSEMRIRSVGLLGRHDSPAPQLSSFLGREHHPSLSTTMK